MGKLKLQPTENNYRFKAWFLPSFGVLIFLAHFVVVSFSDLKMINDPGLGWHLRAGRFMIENHQILRTDLFSYTHFGKPWVTYSWLYECFVALLEKIGGLRMVTAVFSVLFAFLPLLVYRRMLIEKVSVYVAVFCSLVCYITLTPHAHARPHVFTYIFFLIFFEKLLLYDRGSISVRKLLLPAALMPVWANVHGGFVVGIAMAGIFFIISALRYCLSRTSDNYKKARSLLLLTIFLFLTSLVNPFGWKLHYYIINTLSAESMQYMAEFQSPNFYSHRIEIIIFKVAILAFVLFLLYKKIPAENWGECTIIIFLFYQSLNANRHIFLFILAAIPFLGRELIHPILSQNNWFKEKSIIASREQSQIKGSTIWIVSIILFYIFLSQIGSPFFPAGFSESNLSKNAIGFISENRHRFSRMFNSDEVGGALIYHFYPELKVFVDDRNDFYGDDFYLNEYMTVLHAKPGWDKIIDKYEVTSAVLGKNHPACQSVLTASDNWELAYSDDTNYIFFRK